MGKNAKTGATPALDLVSKAGVAHSVHSYDHDPATASYGLEAAEKTGTDAARVFKTLVVSDGKALMVGIVPVEKQLDLKAMATAVKAKSVAMADMALAERTTGYVAGGISPLGQKKSLPTVIDASASEFDTMFVSAGKRGLEVELAPEDLATLTRATFAAIAR